MIIAGMATIKERRHLVERSALSILLQVDRLNIYTSMYLKSQLPIRLLEHPKVTVYDMYDLGEFNQKNTIRTKYGTKDEYLAAIQAAINKHRAKR